MVSRLFFFNLKNRIKMTNLFFDKATICKEADLIPESIMYETIGRCLDTHGAENTLKALYVHANNCKYEWESFLKLFMLEAASELSAQIINEDTARYAAHLARF